MNFGPDTILALASILITVVGCGLTFYATSKVMESRMARAEKDLEAAATERQRLWDTMERNRNNHHTDIETVRTLIIEVNERMARIEGLLKGRQQGGGD